MKLIKNIYRQKQAGRVFFLYLKERLESLGYEQSKVDECIFYKGRTIFFFYVDDGIIVGPDRDEIRKEIELLSTKCNIEDKGEIEDYLVVNVKYQEDGSIHLTQPQLIDTILEELGLTSKESNRMTPALSSKILQRDAHFEDAVTDWKYRSVIGKLNYLEKSTGQIWHMRYTNAPDLWRTQNNLMWMQFCTLGDTYWEPEIRD